MKPVYLEFCGINSFSEKATIDFNALLSGGVFGIFGDTGSGKSTILDCIHLALYGEMERSSGSECIHYGMDSAYVEFDFEISQNGERSVYHVRRERRRKNNIAKAWLYKRNGDKLEALAEGTRDVNDMLREIIGLSFADFKMCIALPQGDFAALVKSRPSDRVKLVSRLFDLDGYGERLFAAVSKKCTAAAQECDLIQAKMGQNEGGSDEAIAQKEEEICLLKKDVAAATEVLSTAEKIHAELQSLKKEKEGYEGLQKELALLRARLPQMQEKRSALEKIPSARAVQTAQMLLTENRVKAEDAARELKKAEGEIAEAQLLFEKAKNVLESGKYEEKIRELSLAIEKVKGAAADFQAEAETQKNLDACRAQYKALMNKCAEEEFEKLRTDLEGRISALDADENFLEYLKHNFKDVFLGDAYAQFRADLRMLAEKYPETQGDVALLLQKYTPSKTDERLLDVALIQGEYKRKQQEVKRLKDELVGLEKRRLDYETNEKEKAFVIKQLNAYQALLESVQVKTQAVRALGSLAELQAELKRWQDSQTRAKQALETSQKNLQALTAQVEKNKALHAHCTGQEAQLLAHLCKAVADGGFDNEQEAYTLLKTIGDERSAKADCDTYFNRLALAESKYAEMDEEKLARLTAFDENALCQADENKRTAKEALAELQRRLTVAETESKRLQALREKYKEFEKELQKAEKQKRLCESLYGMLKGNKLLEFIAEEYLQEICVDAGKTLRSLTGGRYFLAYDKEFKVGDNLDGGNFRAVKTLSGGETFLVSLSLALSLSSAICMKSMRPIEFFFLDEGFGTLDGKLVDTVMDVLGRLSKDFSIGLISHVEELKHRIENKILVTGATESHGSKLRTESF